MCGIIACAMQSSCKTVLHKTLSILEYRGYDSVGVALFDAKKGLQIAKNTGGVANLNFNNLTGNIGIGHTRWATHGSVCVENAHPHCSENFVLVHNGIIENYQALKAELQPELFQSTTDSEVLVHCIEKYYQQLIKENTLQSTACRHANTCKKENKIAPSSLFVQAVQQALKRVEGSYAITVLSPKFPNQIVAARHKCPLIVAKGENNALFFCSDIQAMSIAATEFAVLQEGDIVHIQDSSLHCYKKDGRVLQPKFKKIVQQQTAFTKPQTSFMEKEIFEIPTAMQHCYNALQTTDFTKINYLLQQANAIHVVACGTSYHAGKVFQTLLQRYTTLPIFVHLASEIYSYQKNLVKNDLVIALSQSGETADTLEAVKICRRKGCKILAVTNTQHSSLKVLSTACIWMQAGQEIAVAATKTYVCQLLVLYTLAAKLLQVQGEKLPKFLQNLHKLPKIVQKVYKDFEKIDKLAKEYKEQKAMAVIGRAMDVPTAQETALKIKEITYIFAEAFPAGELKHGSLALIDSDFCVLAIATQRACFTKIENALLEVKSRQGKTILCSPYTSKVADCTILLPKVNAAFMPIVAIVPLQYFACKLSEKRGIQPDKPKNLAKSVTVE